MQQFQLHKSVNWKKKIQLKYMNVVKIYLAMKLGV